MIIGFIAVPVPIQTYSYRPAVLICPKCQTRIPVTSNFCPECGADLRPKKRPPPTQPAAPHAT